MPVIEPQEGYQSKALASPAQILIGGAAAGVGKTWTLLAEDIYHMSNPRFGSVTFRRTQPQIRNQGALWDTSTTLYPFTGATPRESTLEWTFPSGATAKFASLQHESDVLDWQGSQIPLLKFDELTHFTKKMFWYMLSRNRSDCGVPPYVRCTCNPDPDSWVYELIKWWIDEETGLPLKSRDGVLRYLFRYGDEYVWGDTWQQVYETMKFAIDPLVKASGQVPRDFIKSVTFISGSIYDNKKLLSVDPGYLGNLVAQDEQTQLQLLHGSWKYVPSSDDVFDYQALLAAFDNLAAPSQVGRFITADIALEGSDKFIVGVWHGWLLVDLLIMDKSDGPQVVEAIKRLALLHHVPNQHIAYDADGVGGFLGGFVKGALSFHGGSPPMKAKQDSGEVAKEQYENLKAQCAYRFAHRVKTAETGINDYVGTMMYDDKMTVKQRFIFERKAFKKHKPGNSNKLALIPKKLMRTILGGQSPDLYDMYTMRELFELVPPAPKPKVKATRPSPQRSKF